MSAQSAGNSLNSADSYRDGSSLGLKCPRCFRILIMAPSYHDDAKTTTNTTNAAT